MKMIKSNARLEQKAYSHYILDYSEIYDFWSPLHSHHVSDELQ